MWSKAWRSCSGEMWCGCLTGVGRSGDPGEGEEKSEEIKEGGWGAAVPLMDWRWGDGG